MECKTSEICDEPVPTDPEEPWRIHIERWPINGDPGDGVCGNGYIEGIRLGDGADCQSLCAGNEDCKHYCYLDGGSDGNCRTFTECAPDDKTGGGTPTDSYTCYDKPLPTPSTTLAPETTPGVTTIPPSVGPETAAPTTPAATTVAPSEAPATTTPTTTEEEDFIETELPVPEPSPEPGVIEDCCGNDIEAEALDGTCFSKISELPLDSLHGRDPSDTFEDNVYMNYYKYYLESCTFGEECTYTELTDPDPQHHKFRVGKSRVKIEAYDIAGNKYECMRNVYVHDMQPPKFVFGEEQVHSETGATYMHEFSPDSLTVRLEVDKETCNIKASETFSKYETLQGVSGHDVTAHDNCDVVRAGDSHGAEVTRKIYDSDGNILFDSSKEEFTDESFLKTGPGNYKMEIIAV